MLFFRELLKYLLRLIVFPIMTLLIIIVVAFNMIPQAKVRAYAADEIGQRIHRQMEIGPMHFGLRGLTIDTLKLSDGPSFRSGVLFTAKGIHLGWGLRSLWEGLDIRKKFITRSKGHFQVDDFRNPHYAARDFSIRWSLRDMDSTGSHLNGWAKLEQGAGTLENIDKLMETSAAVKLALAPVMTLMNLEKLKILNLGLPDLRHWPIDGIRGDYTFKDGQMTIQQFKIESPQTNMATTGTIDIGSGKVLLDAELTAPKRTVGGALDVKLRVTGTISNPKVHLDSLKKQAFQATISNLLENANLFRK